MSAICRFRLVVSGLCFLTCLSTITPAAEIPVWAVFEQELTATTDHDNPFTAKVVVQFRGPSGREHSRLAFWDGGRTWRVRFSPEEAGTWTWKAVGGDAARLGSPTGQFDVQPAATDNPLAQHGPIRLSEDRLFFEHADGTPWFFLSCTAWNGVLKSTPEEWEKYLSARQQQKFTAIQFVSTQWRGGRETLEAPVFVDGENFTINPEMFQRMDERVQAINVHGMVACPVILWALNDDDPGNALSPENASALARYIVARWGAYDVMWFLAGDCRFQDDSIERWKTLGRELFGQRGDQNLVTLHPSGENWIAEKFRNERWLDFIGYQSGHGDGEKTLRWLLDGPVVDAWKKDPPRPIINLEPNYEAHPAYQSKQEHTPQHVRRAAYWSLMVAPPAGVTYGHNTIWVWNREAGPAEGHGNLKNVGPFTDGIQADGARQMAHVRTFFESGPWTKLRPAQDLLLRQPGEDDPNRWITLASTEDRIWTVAYTPTGDAIPLRLASGKQAKLQWFNPRTGEWSKPQSISGETVTLEPPSLDDWLASVRMEEEN